MAMHVLVTGGPTHEYLDEVRYFGNASSGRMGVALAEAAARRGHAVTLILGPCPTGTLDPRIRLRRVVSARDMEREVLDALPSVQAIIMAAAVADWRPRVRIPGKLKKQAGGLVVELVKNPDILAGVGTMAAGRLVVGFALEAAPGEEALRLAREKLRRKRCDLIVLNRTGSLGREVGEDVVLLTAGAEHPLGSPSKASLAERVISWCEERAGRSDHAAGAWGDERHERARGGGAGDAGGGPDRPPPGD
jgi:phosphopantothenoylcysteine decarboxylase/phosphopantothenate--cysteine ligase